MDNTLQVLKQYKSAHENGGALDENALSKTLQTILQRELRGGATTRASARNTRELARAPPVPAPVPAHAPVPAPAVRAKANQTRKPFQQLRDAAPRRRNDTDADTDDLDSVFSEASMVPAKSLADKYQGIGPSLKKRPAEQSVERPSPRKTNARVTAAAAAARLPSVDEEEEDEASSPPAPAPAPAAPAKKRAAPIPYNAFELSLASRAVPARNPKGKIDLTNQLLQGLTPESARGKLSALRVAARAMGQKVPIDSIEWVKQHKKNVDTISALKDTDINTIKAAFLALQQTAYTMAYEKDLENNTKERDEWLQASKAYSAAAIEFRKKSDENNATGVLSAEKEAKFETEKARETKWLRPLEDDARRIAAMKEPGDATKAEMNTLQLAALISWIVLTPALRTKFYAFLNSQETNPTDNEEFSSFNWYIPPHMLYSNVYKTEKIYGSQHWKINSAREAGIVRANERWIPYVRHFLKIPTGPVPMFVNLTSGERLKPSELSKMINASAKQVFGHTLGTREIRTFQTSENTNVVGQNGKYGFAETAKRMQHSAGTAAIVYNKLLPGRDSVSKNVDAALAALISERGSVPSEDLHNTEHNLVSALIAVIEEKEARNLAGGAE